MELPKGQEPEPRPDIRSSLPPSRSQAQAHEIASTPTPAATVSIIRDTAFASTSATTSYIPPTPSTLTLTAHDSANMMEVDGTVNDRARRATSVLSMDDIEAAQALEGLRTDFVYSPSSHPSYSQLSAPATTDTSPEPLLSLLTSTHPLISSAINGSMSAYTTSKSYSPRFKYGAEFIERNIGTPVASTVGSVSRKTGVEGGLRWALQRRETNDSNERNKRRKVGESDRIDVEQGLPEYELQRCRLSSELSHSENLPPYDDQRSPNYEEVNPASGNAGQPASTTWQNRLMISTSGLGVAISEESLRSLSYCLKWLRWANGRLSHAIVALKNLLQAWDKKEKSANGDASNRAMLSHHVQAVKEDVLRTLKQVVDIVSRYTGGALPENARNLVRRHLTSLPQRFRIASTSHPPLESAASSSDEATNAHRVLVLAQEGLDMMAQVNQVVNDTLVSAETWCERLGRRRPDVVNGNEVKRLPQNQPALIDVKRPIIDTTQRDIEMTGTDI